MSDARTGTKDSGAKVLTAFVTFAALMMTWGNDPTPPPITHSSSFSAPAHVHGYVPSSHSGAGLYKPDRSATSGSQHTPSPDLSISEHGSELYPTPDLATVPLPGPLPSGLVGGTAPSGWAAGDRAGLLNSNGRQGAGAQAGVGAGGKQGGASLADGSDPFEFIFPSWALDSGETSGFISMLNPVLNPEGRGVGEEAGVGDGGEGAGREAGA